jgi:flavin reductase (DIM6/NTAB) family NADH-FMN oxidoreductase RutF
MPHERRHASVPTADQMRAVHRRFITGVTVVTTMDRDEPKGLVVNAFMSLSLEPPVVMVAIQRTSSTYPFLFSSDYMAVNMLSVRNAGAVRKFASKDPDKFSGVSWHRGPNGSPLLDGASAYIETVIRERIQASTHTVFISKVVFADSFGEPPLIYYEGQFWTSVGLEAV